MLSDISSLYKSVKCFVKSLGVFEIVPKAHAEAPVAGSVILAGLILKLATYGFLRVLIPLLPEATVFFSPFIQIIAIVTLIYSSLTTIRQEDFKVLIAYSSVAHLSIVVLALFSNSIQGIEGGVLLSIAHGFVSPGLFILFGGVLYDRYHIRIIQYYRGLTVYMPIFSILLFLFTLSNMSIPLSINWIGEFTALAGIFQTTPIIGLIMSCGIILSAAFSIWLFNRIGFGSLNPHIKFAEDLKRREYMLLLPLLSFTYFLGFFPNVVLNDLHFYISTVLFTILT